jgi:hypothetical protein
MNSSDDIKGKILKFATILANVYFLLSFSTKVEHALLS